MDNYCNVCHTYDDYDGGCKDCPVGNLLYSCKEYLSDLYLNGQGVKGIEEKDLSKLSRNENKTYRKIMKEIKKIEPSPMFNTDLSGDEDLKKDKLEKLRKCLKELEHYRDVRSWSIRFNKIDKDERKAIKLAQIQEIEDK